MRQSLVVALIFAACLAALAQTTLPRMTSVEPAAGKAGDIIAIAGENLGKDQVAKVYLTDGTNDIEVSMTEQAATSIKFKIPAKAKGRLALMILTAGKDSKLIEQPVKVNIEE
jgi:hypothetical protein